MGKQVYFPINVGERYYMFSCEWFQDNKVDEEYHTHYELVLSKWEVTCINYSVNKHNMVKSNIRFHKIYNEKTVDISRNLSFEEFESFCFKDRDLAMRRFYEILDGRINNFEHPCDITSERIYWF